MVDMRAELHRTLMYEFHRLAIAVGHMVNSYSAATELHGHDGEGLLAIWHAEAVGAPLTVSELAEKLSLTRAGATYMVDRLEEKGFVSRVADPVDRRKTRIHVSEAGHDFGTGFADEWNPFAEYSDAQVELFVTMMGELNTQLIAAGHAHQTTKEQ
ncbi:MAG: MarR family transcriptional regulator [Corynebacterium sp.]|nr:MarR family transcriptional regulator [Corynebacterium sp.]